MPSFSRGPMREGVIALSLRAKLQKPRFFTRGRLMSLASPQPDLQVLQRRKDILRGFTQLVAGDALITFQDERRAFETDALTVCRKIPSAVVLPSNIQEVCAVLRFSRDHNVKMVARGAGTSLAEGAIPQDAIILANSKLDSILSVYFMNRTARVQAGVTNLGIRAESAQVAS